MTQLPRETEIVLDARGVVRTYRRGCGLIGLALGFAGVFAGGSWLDVTPVFSWTAAILAIAVAIAVGVLAGIGPAAQASSVEPTTALRCE